MDEPEFETFKVMGSDGKVVEVKGRILAREKRPPATVPPEPKPEPAGE